MKNMKLLSLLLLAVLFTFSSCSKDEDPKPKTKKELLTAKTWKVSKIREDEEDVTNESELALVKNSRTKFNADGTYTQTTSGYNANGVWEFTDNETVLLFDPNTDDEEEWDIVELKDNSLKLKQSFMYQGQDGEVYKYLLELDMVHAE